MERYEIYSTRLKRESGKLDIFKYDKIPQEMRTQAFLIVKDFWNNIDQFSSRDSYDSRFWKKTKHLLSIELGNRELAEETSISPQYVLKKFLYDCSDLNALNVIEAMFHVTYNSPNEYFIRQINWEGSINAIVNELNHRFRQNALGYEFVNGIIIRKDNQYLHSETVKRTLILLHDEQFAGAEHEFFDACQHRLSNRNEECIDCSLKALESVIKTICDLSGFEYNKNCDGATKLIGHLRNNNFFSDNAEINSKLASMMEQGLPPLRNKIGGHGDGKDHIPINDAIADYALHLAATNIVFLVDLFKQKNKATIRGN